MRLFATSTLLISALLLSGASAFADADAKELEDRLRQLGASEINVQSESQKNWRQIAEALGKNGPNGYSECADATTAEMAGRYALSFDDQEQICRIYDLSFPTLRSLFAKQAVAKVPVQSFRARDYINWMKGDYESVLNKMSAFQSGFGSEPNLRVARWVKKIEFRPTSLNTLQNTDVIQATGLPRSFRASDLEIGHRFAFAEKDKRALLEAVEAAGVDSASGPAVMSVEVRDAWKKLIEEPELLLAQMQFQWSDAEKVYEIFIEGEFLPINGPIALVDHGATHKLAVERLLRDLVRSALNQAVKLVPLPARTLISMGINESFDFLNMAYEYQINQLEGTLRAAYNGEITVPMDKDSIKRSQDILFGGRAEILAEIILGAVQGGGFGWDKFADAGRKARHTVEKQRDIALTNMYSHMVRKKGCSMTLTDDYFGVCSKGESKTTYSLISENSILFWNIGAPMIYQHDRTSQVLLLRSASYILSLGASTFELPIASFFTDILVDGLKTYAFAGVLDEAFLRNSVYLEELTTGSLDDSTTIMMNKLYLQNLNPFLPKTRAQENKVIRANAALLGMTDQDQQPQRILN